MKDGRKLTLQEFYLLKRKRFPNIIAEIMAETGKSYSTVYFWVSGKRKPDFLNAKAIRKLIKERYGEEVEI